MFTTYGYDDVVHAQNLAQPLAISFDPKPARREGKSGSLFFAGSFQILEILSPGDKLFWSVFIGPHPVPSLWITTSMPSATVNRRVLGHQKLPTSNFLGPYLVVRGGSPSIAG